MLGMAHRGVELRWIGQTGAAPTHDPRYSNWKEQGSSSALLGGILEEQKSGRKENPFVHLLYYFQDSNLDGPTWS